MNKSTQIMTETEPDAAVDHDHLRARLRAVQERHGLSLSALEKRTGISSARLSQWLSNTYRGDNDKVATTIARYLDQLESAIGVQAAAATDPGFQHTQTASRIWTMLAQAQHAPAMVVVAGVPGVGKTMTARAYAAAGTNVWVATMDPTVTSPGLLLQEVARATGVPIGSATTLRDRLGERMSDSGGLLIVDEAQHCAPKALDMIRALHDRFEVGIALIGNFGFFAGTTAPAKTHGFAQFYRRIRKRAKFEGPTPADIEVMLDAWGVTDREQRRFLATAAGKMWGLSAIANTVHEATTLAIGAEQPLSLQHMKTAWSGLNHFDG